VLACDAVAELADPEALALVPCDAHPASGTAAMAAANAHVRTVSLIFMAAPFSFGQVASQYTASEQLGFQYG